ncbi:Rrf2 family transcriptional regulator [Lichenihabitans sp. Uapishka_5]|uniref:RrF2 family transcriptional regulator n=1 Tax=Lichenihabitans sp. Uapishka_5 TaxID=3037302 RepID=UPI0029E815D9|nr:Rrf2 family transcriptional regulator [Lichenihabitans sp. Uapishka_5]MDX7950115.1 Rrf2 family transcriptional regulator [Lichenihabitans sp. Uapishka_5]
MLPHRALLAIAVVVDVALLARGTPVAAKTLAQRQGRTPRHLESLLQGLVRHGILKGTRGPRGGYELARERRRIHLGEIVRLVGLEASETGSIPSSLIAAVVAPALARADADYLARLDTISIEELTKAAETLRATRAGATAAEFQI